MSAVVVYQGYFPYQASRKVDFFTRLIRKLIIFPLCDEFCEISGGNLMRVFIRLNLILRYQVSPASPIKPVHLAN